MQKFAEKQESRFIKSLLKNTEKDSPAYMYGHALWIIIAGSGSADGSLTTPVNLGYSLKRDCDGLLDVIEQFIPNVGSIKNWDEIDIKPAEMALVECRIIHKSLRFWNDIYEDDCETYCLFDDGNLPDLERNIFKVFSEELEKSKNALATIHNEFNVDTSSLTAPLDLFSALENALYNQKDCKANSDLVARYDSLRGNIEHPKSGKKGCDPLVHLRESTCGSGSISFIDRRYIPVTIESIESELYRLVTNAPELAGLLELAKKNIIDQSVDLNIKIAS